MDKKKVAVISIVVIIFIAVAVGVFFLINGENKEITDNKNTVDKTNPVIESEVETAGETEGSTDSTVENPTPLNEYMEINPEIYSWIQIPDTNVDYPVAQSRLDDNFYLDHDIYKNYSFPGTIYSQLCNKKDYSDRVTVLYGHNMLNGSMFADLLNYSDSDFFNENPYIYIYTVDRKLTYEIVSAFLYDDRHIMNSFDFTDDSVFQSWLDQAENPRWLNSNARDSVDLDLNSKILVLSTCPDYGSGRYLIQGVLISDEKIR